ncbi:MAG: hypothetical protein K6T78_08430 [Alicyclobacillus sp.]|nr:hypothetical protein [Alicyclobacillus sp.]
MQPGSVMNWIAGWIPLLVILASVCLYRFWTRRAWAVAVASILSFGLPMVAMLLWFTMKFWPWLLLYLFLSWLSCWGTHIAGKIRTGALFR